MCVIAIYSGAKHIGAFFNPSGQYSRRDFSESPDYLRFTARCSLTGRKYKTSIYGNTHRKSSDAFHLGASFGASNIELYVELLVAICELDYLALLKGGAIMRLPLALTTEMSPP